MGAGADGGDGTDGDAGVAGDAGNKATGEGVCGDWATKGDGEDDSVAPEMARGEGWGKSGVC